MIARQADAQHRRLVDQVRVELYAAEAHRRRVQRRLGEPDAPPAGDRLRRNAQHFLGDQQVVGEVEILDQASAGQPLEDLAIALNHRPEPSRKCLVLPLARDVLRNRLPHRIGDADPFRACDRLQLVRLRTDSLKVMFLRAISVSRYHASVN